MSIRQLIFLTVLACAATGVIACAATPTSNPVFDWNLPTVVTPPPVLADNPMTEAKFQLGRRLFYDPRLSGNGTQSCATCHVQEFAFTDGARLSTGSTGRRAARNALSLVNAGYLLRLNWADPDLKTLEDQVQKPLFNASPSEMGARGHEAEIIRRLTLDARYRDLFAAAFPGEQEPNTWLNVRRALASFVRGIVSFNSPYDRFVAGDARALSQGAQRGLTLFNSERLKCGQCHGGLSFTSATQAGPAYANTGLYNAGGAGAYPPTDRGLFDATGVARDMGKFRVPSLRNAAPTAPYMHDGSAFTLEEVIRTYERGGRKTEGGEFSGDGKLNPYKDARITGFTLTDEERRDLLAFLASLTDESLLTSPRFGDPWTQDADDRYSSP